MILQPPLNALRYSAEKYYNVRSRDAVEVVQGPQTGRKGIIGKSTFKKKYWRWMCGLTLYVSAPSSPHLLTVYQEHFFMPITNIAHESAVSEVDETWWYVGKVTTRVGGEHSEVYQERHARSLQAVCLLVFSRKTMSLSSKCLFIHQSFLVLSYPGIVRPCWEDCVYYIPCS